MTRIEIPDLGKCTMVELATLDRTLDEQRVLVQRAMYDREKSGAAAAEAERLAAMPPWARKLSTVLQVQNSKKFNRIAFAGAVLFVLLCSAPNLFASWQRANSTLDRAKHQLEEPKRAGEVAP